MNKRDSTAERLRGIKPFWFRVAPKKEEINKTRNQQDKKPTKNQ
jgi:hypothetical protein